MSDRRETMSVDDVMNTVVIEIYAAVFQMPLAQYQSRALDALKTAVPFSSAVWANGMHDMNEVHSILLVNQSYNFLSSYLSDHARADLVRERAFAQPGTCFRIEDTRSIEDYRADSFYRHWGQKLGIEYAMGTVTLDPIANLEELIVLWRSDVDQPFKDCERRIKQLCTPHLIAAWRQRQLLHLLEHSAGSSDHGSRARGHAVIDDAGNIHVADPCFNDMVRGVFGKWIGPRLPVPVQSILVRDCHSLIVDDLEFTLKRSDRRNVLTVVSLGAVDQLAVLTPAERRVARLFAAGQSNTQVAGVIGVSTATVRNQLAAIYRKLGVHSKLELAVVVATLDS